MHILMIAQFYPPTIGGAERHVRDLSIELVARGHKVTVVTLLQKNMSEIDDDNGVSVYRVKGLLQQMSVLFSDQERPHSPPFVDPEVFFMLHRIIQRNQPDIIHVHNWMGRSFTPLKLTSKAKLVVTLHDYGLTCATKRFMYENSLCTGPEFFKCFCCSNERYGKVKGGLTLITNIFGGQLDYKTVDMFLPVSLAIAESSQLSRHKVPYSIIPNFVRDNLDTVNTVEHPLLAMLPSEPFLLFVGNISRDKGAEVLLQAYERMECKMPLVLIGHIMNDFVLRLPSHVHILENWPHEAVLGAWKRCCIAVVPSLWPDPCPTVAMEALSMGIPVVASRIGGIQDIIQDDETGFLFPPGDQQALQYAMQRLVDDYELRKRMGKLALQRVEAFKARTVIPRIESIYSDLCV